MGLAGNVGARIGLLVLALALVIPMLASVTDLGAALVPGCEVAGVPRFAEAFQSADGDSPIPVTETVAMGCNVAIAGSVAYTHRGTPLTLASVGEVAGGTWQPASGFALLGALLTPLFVAGIVGFLTLLAVAVIILI